MKALKRCMHAQDVTEENAEVLLGAKANRGLVPAQATVPRLRHSRSSLPNIPYYEGQAEMLGYSDALTLEPVQEESAAQIMAAP